MPYLIDSHVVIDHLADVPEASELLERLAEDGIAMSIITYMGSFQGVVRSPYAEKAQSKFRALAKSIPILPLSLAVAERCARLRETLRSQNKRVNSRALDLIIAATALEYDLPLVTENTGDLKTSRTFVSPNHANDSYKIGGINGFLSIKNLASCSKTPESMPESMAGA
jgi:predicted nucleic acid-binding protein